jgi:hypothetical protein
MNTVAAYELVELKKVIRNVFLSFWLDFTSHKHSIAHIATIQHYWGRKTTGAHLSINSGKRRHLKTATDIP